MADEPTEKRKGGWPKGKPRKPAEDTGPVLVYLKTKAGETDAFHAVEWSIFEGRFLKIQYYPEKRGEIGHRFVALDSLEDFRIEEPEWLAQKREQPQVAPPVYTQPVQVIPMDPATTFRVTSTPPGPQIYAARNPGENVGKPLPPRNGIVPQSLITSDTDDRQPTIVDGTIY